MSEIVERMAIAMTGIGAHDASWDQCDDEYKNKMRERVRIGLSVLRESSTDSAFQAGIDAALK